MMEMGEAHKAAQENEARLNHRLVGRPDVKYRRIEGQTELPMIFFLPFR